MNIDYISFWFGFMVAGLIIAAFSFLLGSLVKGGK